VPLACVISPGVRVSASRSAVKTYVCTRSPLGFGSGLFRLPSALLVRDEQRRQPAAASQRCGKVGVELSHAQAQDLRAALLVAMR
jgi:hypothetical protein